MKASDLFLAAFIFLIFFILNIYLYVMVFFKNIKNNWPVYRCNPTVMPFANYFGVDPLKNFTFCIQTIQTGFMQEFMQPVFYVVNVMGEAGKEMMRTIKDIKNFTKSFQGMVGLELGSLSGVFQKLQIALTKILIALIDTMARIGGILQVFINLLKGSILTARATFRVCFHPDTLVSMEDGTKKRIEDITLGEKLKKGSEVLGTLKLKPGENDFYYKIQSKKLKKPIYVTGSHFMQEPGSKKFIPVEHYSEAELTDEKTDYMVCLITSDNHIPIGEYTFWDWEDDELSRDYYIRKGFY